MASENEIAIVGIGCNFPGGEGIDSFWKVLENGRNCTTEIPPERFNIREWYDPGDDKPGKIRTTRAALLDELNAFDNKLFGISNEEAERMDPQQKLLMECTYRALEDAGVTHENISGTKTGVFVGKIIVTMQKILYIYIAYHLSALEVATQQSMLIFQCIRHFPHWV
ncbi:putative uncharacterized protein encoded by LINC00614 isoform X2 [Lacerta agilis]|uniref:putative uncharacterized protein encoded by LINC00614 isoform X2 n=1 Tax=Lacerta agilis TaxID=80427 RepID=UPI0014199094|nr:putative uncharacterized protein encoded by LINC00614 [Lacerta agilis]XP_033021993.1 putative uncharacterized protein encoded by LINC00614 isoform X2 [Lacerta agilis]XP_033021994.1 putative uncharacterized protein encoded by LINC00614 isoform X2 [Lacerta agilis]